MANANQQTSAQAELSTTSRAPTPVQVSTMPQGTDLDYLSAHQYLIKTMLASMAGSTLVKVVAVTNNGGVSPIGSVDVQPLVNQVDGAGNAYPHGVIKGLPYGRIQGGTNAVILDPKVGDIGIACFCDRDISGVKNTLGQSNPGSRRQHDMSDGIYVKSVLGGNPQQYVQFTDDGVTIVSPLKVTIQAPETEIDSTTSLTINAPNVTINGTVTVSGDVVAEGTSLHTHLHGGVQSGGGTTGRPI